MPARASARHFWHERARAELFEATDFYADQGGTLADDFLTEVERGIRFIVRNPGGAPVISAGGVRRKVLARFPYSLLYIPEPNRIRIVGLMHHKRRPGYWTGRA